MDAKRQAAASLVVVGGGPAGLTTALAFAAAAPDRVGDVVVLERARYPRDKPCAGALGRRGDDLLATLGVRVDVPGVVVHGMHFAAAAGARAARAGNIGRVIRRAEFDAVLAREARARGIRIVEGAKVDAIETTEDGVDVLTAGGARWCASFVVGADGVGSLVRRSLTKATGEAPSRCTARALRAQVLEVETGAASGDVARDLLAFDTSEPGLRGYYWDFPVPGAGGDLVCRGVYRLLRSGRDDGQAASDGAAAAVSERDLTTLLEARLQRRGLSLAGCTRKRFSERGYVRQDILADERHLLVGEAAGIDAVTGEGIAQAIEYGVLAGPFLARVIAGSARLPGWPRLLARSRLGIDLRLRSRLARSFYGSSRAELEAFLLDGSSAVLTGCRHFGGKPHDARTLAEAALHLGSAWLAIRARKIRGQAAAGPSSG